MTTTYIGLGICRKRHETVLDVYFPEISIITEQSSDIESLLNMFSSACTFFFATSFDIGGHDNILRAQWPLGVALRRLQPPLSNTHAKKDISMHRKISKM